MKITLSKVVLATGFAALVAGSSAFAGETVAAPVKEVVVIEEAENWWNAELSVGYDSLYMFRGVNFANDLVTADLSFSAFGITAGAWYGSAYNDDYNELDLYISYTHSFNVVDLTGGYIYYDFPKTGGDTSELFASISTSALPYVTPSLSYYYDIDAIDGSYLELRFDGSIPVVADRLSIDPYTSISYDFDYNTDGNNWNNWEIGVELPFALSENVTISGYAAYSVSLDRLADFQSDEFWGGGKVTFSF